MKTPLVLTAALATALIASPAATIASAPPTSIMNTMNVPARDLGPCWAQAGRVVGGGIGVIGSSVTAPCIPRPALGVPRRHESREVHE